MAKNILIIDDEELIIKSLTKLLKKNGFTVFVAKRGEDGLIMIEEEKFDLIIADIKMPGMNGIETIQAIYENLRKKECKMIPTVFITGYIDEEIEKKAKTLGPIDYIYKPFDTFELFEKINKILK